jgi:hypothetical protein
VNVVGEELAVQVKRHREKRRKRREARSPVLPDMAAAGAMQSGSAAELG